MVPVTFMPLRTASRPMTVPRAQPLDLATALSSRSPVGPGRTVWLLGGTYRAGVTSQLVGRADAPIVVRPAPGERVILDGANPEAIGRGVVLTVLGAHTWFWGFEVTFSSDTRTDTGRPSEPNGIYANESSRCAIHQSDRARCARPGIGRLG